MTGQLGASREGLAACNALGRMLDLGAYVCGQILVYPTSGKELAGLLACLTNVTVEEWTSDPPGVTYRDFSGDLGDLVIDIRARPAHCDGIVVDQAPAEPAAGGVS